MKKDNRLDSQLIDRLQIEDGTTLQIWRGASADELTVRLASSSEELPFLRVACPNFVPVVVLASALYSEVLGIQKAPDGTFAIATNRGHYHIKRADSGEWAIECVSQTAVKLSDPKHRRFV